MTNFLVLNYDSVTVCDGMAKKIQCPKNENIHVLQGFYGKWRNHDCHGESADPDNLPTCSEDRKKSTGIARDRCQGNNSCKLIADRSIFGEPCKQIPAYLYVTFFCMAPGQKLHHQRTEYNQEVVTVPSHGFVVEELKHNVSEMKEKNEEAKKTTLLQPPGNPTSKENNSSIVGTIGDTRGDIVSTDGDNKSMFISPRISKIDKDSKTLILVEGEESQKSKLPITYIKNTQNTERKC